MGSDAVHALRIVWVCMRVRRTMGGDHDASISCVGIVMPEILIAIADMQRILAHILSHTYDVDRLCDRLGYFGDVGGMRMMAYHKVNQGRRGVAPVA